MRQRTMSETGRPTAPAEAERVPGPRPAAGPGGGGGRRRGGETRRKRGRVVGWVAGGLALLILGAAGGGWLYIEHLNNNLTKDDLHLGDNKLEKSQPNAAGQAPMNILLLGSDSRNSDENVRLGGARGDRGRPPLADVQMLLHVSADRSNMSVLSIPRDTRVTIPKCTDPDDKRVYAQRIDKINASLQNGGPGCTVATWEELTGIPIDHFMMVDFAGVVSMADAVGGVPVCVDRNVHDRKSGLRLKAGETVVRGEQALQWLRTRHGFEDGSDLGRAKAQHMYMNAMVRELKAGTKLTNPGKLRNLAEQATRALTVDNGLGSVKKLYDLGEDLRRVPTKRITMATMPWVYSQGGSYVLPKEGDAEKVFSMIRHDIALDGRDKGRRLPDENPEPSDPAAPPAEINVRVLNGTGTAAQAPVAGRASLVAGRLQHKGFSRAWADTTRVSKWDTQISYGSADLHGDALAVAEALGIPRKLVRQSAAETGITLTVGADWRAGADYPNISTSPAPGPSAAPDATADPTETPREDGAADHEDDSKVPDSLDGLNGDDNSACMTVNPRHTF
nr:LCP family protein [Streptomyces alkaliterrae]